MRSFGTAAALYCIVWCVWTACVLFVDRLDDREYLSFDSQSSPKSEDDLLIKDMSMHDNAPAKGA